MGGAISGNDVGNLFDRNFDYSKGQGSPGAADINRLVGQALPAGENYLNAAQNNTTGNIAGQVQSNPMLSGLYGQGGAMSQALNQYKDEQDNGSALTNTDLQAYGQASDNITRQFGQNNQSLSQSLSDRGLSNSGASGAAFSTSLGNKNEQLAGLQTQIAQNRQQMNKQLMGQTQNFISQIGQGAQGALNSQYSQNNTNAQANLNAGQYSQGYLSNEENQANQGMSQQLAGRQPSALSQAMGAVTGFASSAGSVMSGMGSLKSGTGSV